MTLTLLPAVDVAAHHQPHAVLRIGQTLVDIVAQSFQRPSVNTLP